MDNAQPYATANLPLPLTSVCCHQHVCCHLPKATVSRMHHRIAHVTATYREYIIYNNKYFQHVSSYLIIDCLIMVHVLYRMSSITHYIGLTTYLLEVLHNSDSTSKIYVCKLGGLRVNVFDDCYLC